MKLEEFKDFISVADYKMCESKMDKNPTCYPLKLDNFVKFLYKVNFDFFSSFILFFLFDAFILYTYLHFLERNIECSQYCIKVVP